MQEDKSQSIDEFLSQKGLIVDLRTPAEYKRGHIPTAINVPIFTDEERKEVGRVFKLQGPFKATQLGLKYVGPKLSDIVTLLNEKKNFPVKVYCSRGGMRSQSMVWLLNFCRISAISLRNGYKSYRRRVQDLFLKSIQFHLIQPSLGVSTKKLIDLLKKEKKQVLDIEEMASASLDIFSESQGSQPTTEHFENLLAHFLDKIDFQKPVWLQNVGKEIGSCKIPPSFMKHFKMAPLYLIKEEKEKRIESLVSVLETKKQETALEILSRYKKKLGSFKYKLIFEAFNEKNYRQMAEILADHFDKISFFHLKKHKGNLISCTEDEFHAISS